MTAKWITEFLLMCSFVFVFFTCGVAGINLTLEHYCPTWCERASKLRVVVSVGLTLTGIVLVASTAISGVIAEFYPTLEATR